MAKIDKEKQIAYFMEKLRCTREEAEECIQMDEVIDKGGRTPYDLSPEEEKAAKKMANAKRQPTAYKFQKRERKENATKAGIIAEIAKFLTENSEFSTENVEITNKERMIAFKIGENAYEITLVQKRKPKN